MKNQLFHRCMSIIMLVLSINVFSQQHTVTGIMTDNEGLPLPGVNIFVKGTNIGTQTDFDGNYTINCNVGDVLSFSYVGFSTREVVVTSDMFDTIDTTLTKNIAVIPIQNKAYTNAVEQYFTKEFVIPNIANSTATYNKNGLSFEYERIKNIKARDDEGNLKLTYFKPDIFYEIEFSTTTGLQFVQQRNLPKLQNIFSQGQPAHGQNTYFGPDEGVIFSYGPRLSSLYFDGSAYPYDQNGRLVIGEDRTKKPAIAYDNSIFSSVIKTKNYLLFNVSTSRNILKLEYRDNRAEDIFKEERSRFNQVALRYNTPANLDRKVKWNAYISYDRGIDNQPNLNGFLNTVMLNAWATPTSFENKQGTLLSEGAQRSFSSTSFNNPIWMLQNNRNKTTNSTFLASLQNKIRISDNASIHSNINYTHSVEKQDFGVFPSTVGYINGYSSDKNVTSDIFNTLVTFKLNRNKGVSEIDFTSTANYSHNHMAYELSEKHGFDAFSFNNPTTIIDRHKSIGRNTLQFLNKLNYRILDWETTISLANTSFASSIQNSEWLLPKIEVTTDLRNLFDNYWVRNLKFFASTSFDAKDMSLYYTNQSHNTLNDNPSQNLGFTFNDDLFIKNDLKLEKRSGYSFGTYFGFREISFDFSYYNQKIKNSVFPVKDQGRFELKNIADIEKYGFEGNLNILLYLNGNFSYSPGVVFSLYRNKVVKIYSDQYRIPIAGFSSISKNLILGHPAGVIVGTTYARDNQNNLVINSDGYPILAPEPQIVGDPTPDYAIGFSNDFRWKNFKFSFLIDFQKGGDVWNGTQNTLNYLGTSEQSAKEREITGYVFDGVNQLGQTNVVSVDFANPNNGISGNRFVRYGFEGVAEEAIVDGSYINLKSINLSYSMRQYDENNFIRKIDVGVYANNLFTFTKYKGASPYSSMFDQASGQGLHFFNTPITSEVGLQIKVKI
ncbi:carboxypeptidase-like regulatory domain-containing protein [Aquimarina sediminis]|uniref:carboxypeptidase-like regulatory domain-containing protein n=1 Tax=Aquimarina sediminis TaxID=2070536 RepID=UPI000CA0581A|nr:carboxypeptidase-like regulatory domain-containing protein [Aquimarina sediminis]